MIQFNWSDKTIEEIKDEIKSSSHGYQLRAYGISDFMIIRASIVNSEKPPTNVERFSYPPKEVLTSNNRANQKSSSMFYGATTIKTAVEEVSPKVGDIIYVSYWWVKKPLFVIPVGYTKEIVDKLGSDLDIKKYVEDEGYHNEIANHYLTKIFFDEFTKLEIKDPNQDYNPSIAISEFYFSPALLNPTADNSHFANVYMDEEGRPSKILDALSYPSIKNGGRGHNYAIQPAFVDSGMGLVRVDCFQVLSKEKFKRVRYANFPSGKEIMWHEEEGGYVGWALNTQKGLILITEHEGQIKFCRPGNSVIVPVGTELFNL